MELAYEITLLEADDKEDLESQFIEFEAVNAGIKIVNTSLSTVWNHDKKCITYTLCILST